MNATQRTLIWTTIIAAIGIYGEVAFADVDSGDVNADVIETPPGNTWTPAVTVDWPPNDAGFPAPDPDPEPSATAAAFTPQPGGKKGVANSVKPPGCSVAGGIPSSGSSEARFAVLGLLGAVWASRRSRR